MRCLGGFEFRSLPSFKRVWGAKISVLPANRRFLGDAPSFGTPHDPVASDALPEGAQPTPQHH
jgi:hypothetical protein